MKLLITADWHLRKEVPSCRDDEDWIAYQRNVLDFIADISKEKRASICIVGDIFDKAKEDVEIINLFLNFVKKVDDNIYIIAGNHDLLYHNSLDLEKTSFGIIWKNEKIKPLWKLGVSKHFNEEQMKGEVDKLLFLHDFVYIDKNQSFFNKGFYAYDLFELYPKAQWIFTGDNHYSFVCKKDGKILINPGCITIQTADMINYQPKIFIFDTQTEDVEEIKIPDFGQKFTNIEERKKFDKEIDSFIELLKNKKELSFDFITNLKNSLSEIKDEKLLNFLENFIKELI